MKSWKHRVKVYHLLTKQENLNNIQSLMHQIADILDANVHFLDFNTRKYKIMANRDCDPVAVTNSFIDELYDFARKRGIWIG